jgi:tetratricopeptide (TPR) repeat protein
MNTRLRYAVLVSVAVVAMALAPTAWAERGTTPQTIAGLGTVTFPTSAKSDAAQTAFARGLLLLHLFEYPDAAAAFQQAEQLDPGFAMAYWGEAMTYNHPVWNELDLAAGRAALRKLGATDAAREARAPSAREKTYLATVNILYFGKGTKRQRDASYCDAMQRLATAYPHDNNAQLFHALALLGRNEGVRNIPDYLHAAAIARHIFKLNPQNPGAAHYWIHGMDDPQHAAGALVAARALSQIAPDAGHAQHMTSHIFMALGMWDDVVTANENATRVVYAHAKAAGKPQVHCFHYNEWLEYAYFQQGRQRDAENLLQACRRTGTEALRGMDKKQAAMFRDQFQWSLMQMRATAVVESHDWDGAAAQMRIDTSTLGGEAGWNDFAIGYAAAERGDAALAKTSLAALDKLAATTQPPNPDDPQQTGYLKTLRDDLDGVIASKRGAMQQALASVRRAAQHYDGMAFDFGPPAPVKPPHELLGELLLATGKPAAACTEFEAALKKAPNRTQSLLGLAQAQAASHDTAAAVATYQRLVKIWHAADAGLPGLDEARRYLGTQSHD